MKEPNAITDAELREMPAVKLNEYIAAKEQELLILSMTRSSVFQEFHSLARILKNRTMDFKDFQVAAYNLKTEYERLGRENTIKCSQLLQLKRDWERIHGTAQVGVWQDGKVKREAKEDPIEVEGSP